MNKLFGGTWLTAMMLLVWLGAAGMMTGCSFSKDKEDKVRDLDFTVATEAEIPEELRQIIGEKLAEPFKLTFSDDTSLYIVVGFGKQPTGGYSIALNELYLTENSIVIDTELLGPEKGETTGTEESFPYIVIRTEYLENPVVFQ